MARAQSMSDAALARGVLLPARPVWINGRLLRGDQATISLFDRGARDGEGLFETLRIYGGRPFQWTEHLERLVLSAAELGFPVPPSPDQLRAALDQLLEAERLADAVARITVTRGVPGGRPTRTGAWAEVEPIASRLWRGARPAAETVANAGPNGRAPIGAKVIFSLRRFEPGPLGCHKTTSRLAYHLAREEARAARADEALLVSGKGEVLEGAASNVFAVIGDEVLTPPLASGILPGIARRTVLALCKRLGIPAREQALTRADLAAANEMFLTNSVQEVLPVAKLEGRALPARDAGLKLLAAYRAATRELSTIHSSPDGTRP